MADRLLGPLTQYFHTFVDGKFKPVIRSKYLDSHSAHVELHYKDRATPVPYTAFPSDSILSRRKLTTGIVLPFSDDDAFEDLHSYLTTGRYEQPIPDKEGPPRIEENFGVEENLVLKDIRAYRIGAILRFRELQKYALERLWAHRVTYEDPVNALEYLYHGPEPKDKDKDKKSKKDGKDDDKKKGDRKDRPVPADAPLRKWARTWLKVRSREYGANLDLLKMHPTWSGRWNKLKEKGGELIVDVDAVQAELDRRFGGRRGGGWAGWGLPGRFRDSMPPLAGRGTGMYSQGGIPWPVNVPQRGQGFVYREYPDGQLGEERGRASGLGGPDQGRIDNEDWGNFR